MQGKVSPLTLRNTKHMRNALGFYPCATNEYKSFEALNSKCVDWLKNRKITGRNARDKFEEIAVFADEEAKFLYEEGVLPTLNACYTLVFATVLNAVGSYEDYLTRLREKSKPSKK